MTTEKKSLIITLGILDAIFILFALYVPQFHLVPVAGICSVLLVCVIFFYRDSTLIRESD